MKIKSLMLSVLMILAITSAFAAEKETVVDTTPKLILEHGARYDHNEKNGTPNLKMKYTAFRQL